MLSNPNLPRQKNTALCNPAGLRENSRHRTAGARVKMGHGESNVPWGTRTAIAGARKLPKIRASNEIAIGLGLGFVGALPR